MMSWSLVDEYEAVKGVPIVSGATAWTDQVALWGSIGGTSMRTPCRVRSAMSIIKY